MSREQEKKLKADYYKKCGRHLSVYFIGFNKWLKHKPHYWVTYCQYDQELEKIKKHLLGLDSVSEVDGKLFYHNLPITFTYRDAHQGGW